MPAVTDLIAELRQGRLTPSQLHARADDSCNASVTLEAMLVQLDQGTLQAVAAVMPLSGYTISSLLTSVTSADLSQIYLWHLMDFADASPLATLATCYAATTVFTAGPGTTVRAQVTGSVAAQDGEPCSFYFDQTVQL